jgi:hypothetical protein
MKNRCNLRTVGCAGSNRAESGIEFTRSRSAHLGAEPSAMTLVAHRMASMLQDTTTLRRQREASTPKILVQIHAAQVIVGTLEQIQLATRCSPSSIEHSPKQQCVHGRRPALDKLHHRDNVLNDSQPLCSENSVLEEDPTNSPSQLRSNATRRFPGQRCQKVQSLRYLIVKDLRCSRFDTRVACETLC